MIDYRESGDLFAEDVEALVNPVNCLGVMGKGLALAFRQRFPENFRQYHAFCTLGKMQPGVLFVTPEDTPAGRRLIINLPTKRDWRDPSHEEDVALGLAALAGLIGEQAIGSVALPALGCGLGGLDWHECVKPMIETMLGGLDGVHIVVFEPQ